MFDHILVICTGNICRSPIAEGLLQQALPKRRVHSAGTSAVIGAGADPHSVAVSQAKGLDISGHIAKQVTQGMLQEADLVLVLDSSHSAWLHGRFPQFRGKVHKLGKWRQEQDVLDPYMHPVEAFEDCYQHVESLVQDWLKRV